ncbi:MAG: glycoside hydrolase family 3 C-terminal domain-containing protein [Pseudobutyrivibrio sp.]|nr:glycoside hydrolase family 3 C-terminal domain-containing protein [Pseudobutyrivibrio sp.]
MQQYEKEHLDYVLNNAAECTVLLKSNGQFPLEKPGKLAAFGAGMRYTINGGTGSGEVNSRFTYTIEEGLEKEGFEITSKTWLDAYDNVRAHAKKAFQKQVRKDIKEKYHGNFLMAMGRTMTEPDHNLAITGEGDTAIYVLSRNSGEGNDREVVAGEVSLNATEVRNILAINKKYEKFMLVLNVGGVVDLSPVMEVENILLISQLGVDIGKVLADILVGKQNPSGKLTTTWAAWDEYSNEGTFGDWNETKYKEGIYVGYRYFDTYGRRPLFPFGYGLSYTIFDIGECKVASKTDYITVNVTVKNTGAFSGKEVVQLYISKPVGMLDQPYQELVGYGKTKALAAGEEQQLSIEFKLSDFASYDENSSSYILERGDYILRVGNSSRNTKIAAVINLNENVVCLKAKNCLGTPDFKEIKCTCALNEQIPAEATRIQLMASDFTTDSVNYDYTYEVDERVKALSDEELAYLAIGGFDLNAKGLSAVGNASIHVAGAAGETTSQLESKGIKPLIMADGPAGLRLSRTYYENEKGAVDASAAGAIPESMLELMNPVVRFIAKLVVGQKKVPKDAVIKEQAATMIPIGTAVAQSFNYELAKKFGDIVGSEMERFGVHLWLAPALNIHRSILCGRNFEYYSEDPLVAGLTAAAITEGVQAHSGCGTTIKHYAANNAETNRYSNNSQVSERAMREIYLRGFGICVGKAQPCAVMTSYNLLNGTHTAEHAGLIEDILRREYGFKGIVMTDWVLPIMADKNSTHRIAVSDEVAKAGGDLFMPGTKADYDRVLQALKDGSLSRKQLEINGSRVATMVDRLSPSK